MKEGQENRTIVEQTDLEFRVTEICLNHDEKTARLDSFKKLTGLKDSELPGTRGDRVILALNSKNAKTVSTEFVLERADGSRVLDEGELDNLISKALWRFLDEYRGWASALLDVADMEMVLAEIEILNITVDGKNVLDPVGLRGAEVGFSVRGTFVPRETLHIIEMISDLGDAIKVVERGHSLASAMEAGDFFVQFDHSSTSVFKYDDSVLKLHKNHDTGLGEAVRTVRKEMVLDEYEARGILKRFLENKLSDHFHKYLEDKLASVVDRWHAVIKDTIGRKRKVEVKTAVPIKTFEKHFADMEVLSHVHFREVLESKGFNVIMKEGLEDVLAHDEFWGLAAGDFSSKYVSANKLLERRARWLLPSVLNK